MSSKILIGIVSIIMLVLLAGCNGENVEDYRMMDETKWDTYSDTWACVDELGRTVPGYEEVGPRREYRYVGIFYHLWHHNTFYLNGAGAWGKQTSDVTRILREDPSALDNYKSPLWRSTTPFYWGKPIFGYYDLQYDDYVLRKHAQMLSDIGVDVLVIDLTNFTEETPFFYDYESLMHLCKVFTDIREDGGKTPQFTWLLRWNNLGGDYGIRQLYNDIYSKNLYSDLWFMWEGKPLLIGDKSSLDPVKDKEIIDFFTWRSAHPEYTAPDEENDWAWNSIYPQYPAYTSTNDREEVAVGTAQNWTHGLAFFSSRDEEGNFIARGRSYHNGKQPLFKDPISSEYPSKYGHNFQEGLDRALEIDPNFIFITAWNEWIGGRFNPNEVPSWAIQHNQPAGGAFCDGYTPEFSRDIEPTLDGDLGDNFYYQLAIAIRKYKGVRRPEIGKPKPIIIDGNFDDWKDVRPEFRDDMNDKAIRNAKSLEKNVTYVNDTGRNDFKLMKVSTDKDNVYFYVETVDHITSYTDKNWMLLFIKTDDDKPNWQGYNFVVNRVDVKENTTTLEKSLGNWQWETVASDIRYVVSGNKMELAIPKKQLGLKSGKIDIQFKWHDNMQNVGDVYEFMLNGDAAPNNRFNYRYMEEAEKSSFTRNLYTIAGVEDSITLKKGEKIAIRFEAEYDIDGMEIFLSPPGWESVDNSSSKIRYEGTWGQAEEVHFSNIAGSSVTFVFTGTGVRWIGDKAPDRGIVEVYLDGKLVEEVDTYGTQLLKKQVLYEITGLENKEHELRIVVTDNMGKDSVGTYQSVDCFEYLPSTKSGKQGFEYRLYKWRNSYKSSISKWAVKKGTVKNAELGKWLSLEKAKLEKGEYVLVIETKSDLSINAYGSNYDNVTLFVGGKEENGCLKIRARYKSA